MNQIQSSARFSPLARWQRLSIRNKLLLPIILALAVGLFVVVVRVIPPINEHGEQDLRSDFDSRLEDGRGRLTSFLNQNLLDMLNLGRSAEVQDYATAQLNSDTTAMTTTKARLSTLLMGRVITAPAPYNDMLYVTRDGQMVVHAAVSRVGAAKGGVLLPLVKSDIINTYLRDILALPEGQAYVLPPKMSDQVPNSAETPQPVFQIAMPIYRRGSAVGALIGSFRVNDFLKEAFHAGTATSQQLTLLDQKGNVIVSAIPSDQTTLVTLGQDLSTLPQIPKSLLDDKNHELTNISGQLYGVLALQTDTQGAVKIPWTLVVSNDEGSAFANARELSATILGTLALVFVILAGGLALISRSLTQPLILASQGAAQLAAGNFQAKIPVLSQDEVGQVAIALNSATTRIAELVSTLEQRVGERTRNIEIAAEIGREAAQLRDIKVLLQRAVDAIKERFGFYHAQVFLLNETRDFAVLITSTGEAGKQLLSLAHKLPVGSDSVVGQVTEKGRTFITLDTAKSDVPHRFNPILPKTRSEMALPLRVGNAIIGALDIQSVEPDAFGESDVQIFEILTDQLAVAIDNARLLEVSESRIKQIAELNRQLTRDAWTEFLKEENPADLSFKYDLMDVQPNTSTDNGQVSVDITVRGEAVGSLSVQENPQARLSEDDRSVLQSVADRVALAVENARLIEESQQAVSKIERLYQASRTLGSAVDLESVFKVASEYLATFDALDRLIVLMARPNPVPDPQYYEYVQTWNRKTMPMNPFQAQNRLPGTAFPFKRIFPNPRLPHILDIKTELIDHQETLRALEMTGVRSVVAVPLVTATAWHGMLLCESEREYAFSPGFVQFASAIADQLAVAIDNRRLFESVQAEARRNRALAEAAQVSSQIGLDFETGLTNLFEAVADPANYDRWWFGQLINSDTGVILQRVTSHFGQGSPLHTMAKITLRTEQNAVAEATRLNELVVVNDPLDHHALGGMERSKAQAFGKHISMPVRAAGTIVGSFLVGRDLTSPDFDERDVQLAVTLASQIAVVIENQRLFNTAETGRQTLQAVLNSLPTGVMVLDAESKNVLLTNELARNLLGLDDALPYAQIHTGTEMPYAEGEFPPERVLSTKEPIYAEDMTVVSPTGERIDLIVNAAPIFDQENKLLSAVAVFQDVSELRELENVLQDSLRETTSLYEISRAIAGENELTNILGVVATQVVGVLSAKYVFAIFRDEQGYPDEAFVAELKDNWRVTQVEGPCPLPIALLSSEEVYVEGDISSNPELAGDVQLTQLGINSVGVFPLNARGRTVGWLAIGLDYQKQFTAEERRFLSTLADQAAVAAENARLSQATTQALSETTLLYEASYTINRASSTENALDIVRNQVRAFAPILIDVYLVIVKHETSTIEWVLHWDANDPSTSDEIRLVNAPLIDDTQLIDAPANSERVLGR